MPDKQKVKLIHTSDIHLGDELGHPASNEALQALVDAVPGLGGDVLLLVGDIFDNGRVLNIFEIINAAKTKPFAFMPHYPGAGVGGECIPVDTWYLISQAKKLGIDTKLMKTARQVNDSMPEYMITILENELRKFNKEIGSSKISILGLCYKKNLPDIRLSPTLPIIEILSSKDAEVIVCDPVYENISSTIKCTPISEAFKNSNAILLVTDHDEFATLDFEKIKNEMRTPIVIDGRNFFSNEKLTSLGFNYRAIGKP